MMKSFGGALWLVLAVRIASAQQVDVPREAFFGDARTSGDIPTLAAKLLSQSRDGSNRQQFLDDQFRLQMAAGQYREARATLAALRDPAVGVPAPRFASTYLRYDIYAAAQMGAQRGRLPFDEAFRQAFRNAFKDEDGVTASLVIDSFGSSQDVYGPRVEKKQDEFRQALARWKGATKIVPADALDLVRKYEDVQVFGAAQRLTDELAAEDDRRRYLIQDDVQVRTPDGASISTLVVRPRDAAAPLPTLLKFTIYANRVWSMKDARLSAAHGYVGVVSYTRGKGYSADDIVPFEHDGADADAVIEWIARQRWSDGQVGMYSGSYNGFTQWAATKHLPEALKAIMPSAASAPGIDTPMEGNVFETWYYRQPMYFTDGRWYGDGQDQRYNSARWPELMNQLYTSGKAYRDLPALDGAANPFYMKWLDHPGYDAYWQTMIPYGKEFARITIPVLTTTGYYDGAQISALYYFREHHRYAPRAEHYLVVGPYDHIGAQSTPRASLPGYEVDPAARIDIGHVLRYEWFDYVLRHGPKPVLLADSINYEVMGADTWKHAPSLDAMSNTRLRFYLDPQRTGDFRRLSERKPGRVVAGTLTVDLSDRSDVGASASGLVIDKALDSRNSLVFVSPPMDAPMEVSGFFGGLLDFVVDKKDMDINIALYERMPDGRYFQLSSYVTRASYARDRSHRELLMPGKHQQLPFTSGRLTSRLVQQGSQLVVVLGVIKQPDEQINYGTGGDVGAESVADAGRPLRIQWYGDSYIDFPVWK